MAPAGISNLSILTPLHNNKVGRREKRERQITLEEMEQGYKANPQAPGPGEEAEQIRSCS